MKSQYLFFSILLFAISCKQASDIDGHTRNTQHLVVFSDSAVLKSNVVLDFFRHYLDEVKNSTAAVCYFEFFKDTLYLTIEGARGIKGIFGDPIGGIAVNGKPVLFDFGTGKIINRQQPVSDLLDKLGYKKSDLELSEEGKLIVYNFPAWQIKICRDGNYEIKKGVRPPSGPTESNDTAMFHYKIPSDNNQK